MRPNQKIWAVLKEDFQVEQGTLVDSPNGYDWNVDFARGRRYIVKTELFTNEGEACLRCAELCRRKADVMDKRAGKRVEGK